jgi:hypothetical protein
MSNPFAAKNAARKDGKSRTSRAAYREARSLRQGVQGAFGQQPKSFWKAASVGTQGESIDGGVKESKRSAA